MAPRFDPGLLLRRVAVWWLVLGLASLVVVVPMGAVAAQLEPPRQGQAFEFTWLSVGEVRELDASAAFAGSVDSYTATSSNEAAVSVSVTGSVIRLKAVTVGYGFVEVRASNTSGSASQRFAVVSLAGQATRPNLARDAGGESAPSETGGEGAPSATGDADAMLPIGDEPSPGAAAAVGDDGAGSASRDDDASLGIALVSQAWCFTWEMHGMFMGETDELPPLSPDEVQRFSLSYWVVGGRAPYEVTSVDAAETASTSAGVLRIACGIPTASSDDSGGRAYLPRDAGPLTITVTATDANGATASTEMVVVMSPGALSFIRSDGMCRTIVDVPGMDDPGSNYVLGTPTAWTLVTLAPSLQLRFEALDSSGIATFADRETGWEVLLDWRTGEEVGRTVGEFPSSDPAVLEEREPTPGGGIGSTSGEMILAC